MDHRDRWDSADPKREFFAFLAYNGIPYVEDSESVRFVLADAGRRWEMIARFAAGIVLLYGIYPERAGHRQQALEIMNEINAQLQKGSLFLSENRLVLRTSAVLADSYFAQEAITQAVEYNASVMRYFWDKMRRCV